MFEWARPIFKFVKLITSIVKNQSAAGTTLLTVCRIIQPLFELISYIAKCYTTELLS